VVVLDLSGRITIGEGTLMLRDRIQKMLEEGDMLFLLNLSEVDYIDSSGLGELVSSFTTVRNQGRITQAPELDPPGPGPDADHQTPHGLRRLRK
jgi:anti-anti-sigma factor